METHTFNVEDSEESGKQKEYLSLREKVIVVSRSHYWVHTSVIEDAPEPHIWREMSPPQFFGLLTTLGYKKNEIQALISRLLCDSGAMCVTPEHCLQRYPFHQAGYQQIDGQPYFIAQDWTPIAAEKGDPTPAIRLILRMFHHEADLLLGWMKGAYIRQLNYAAKVRNKPEEYPPYASQTLCISGEQGTGKTQFLFRCVISPLLGDFAAIPSAWLTGASRFADWTINRTLYLSDDNSPLLSIKHRKAAATALKNLGYPQKVSCECKGKGAISVDFPNERVFITNMSEESIRALPDFSEDGDKFLVLHNCAPAGMEDYDNDPRRMQAELEKSIPALAYWLLHEYTVPEWAAGKKGNRHVVMNLGKNYGYISPVIKSAISQLDGAGILISKIRRLTMSSVEYTYCGRWLTLSQLRNAIEMTNPSHVEFGTDKALGSDFAECTARWPHLVEKRRGPQGMQYWIAKSKQWENELQIDEQNDYGAVLNAELLSLVHMTQEDFRLPQDEDAETDSQEQPDNDEKLQLD